METVKVIFKGLEGVALAGVLGRTIINCHYYFKIFKNLTSNQNFIIIIPIVLLWQR